MVKRPVNRPAFFYQKIPPQLVFAKLPVFYIEKRPGAQSINPILAGLKNTVHFLPAISPDMKAVESIHFCECFFNIFRIIFPQVVLLLPAGYK